MNRRVQCVYCGLSGSAFGWSAPFWCNIGNGQRANPGGAGEHRGNVCGVRIPDDPLTLAKMLAGLKRATQG